MLVTDAVEHAIEDLRAGRMVVLRDDVDRAGEGCLCMAADLVSAADIAFMSREGCGLIRLALPSDRCRTLGLERMVPVDARHGIGRGVSTADRAHTVRTAVAPEATARDLVQPGHVFPLGAQPGGVLERPGQVEAAVDLARLAGHPPGAVICELLDGDGSIARGAGLERLSRRHGLHTVGVGELVTYRRCHDANVERVVSARLPTLFGEFTAIGYRSFLDDRHHLALTKGSLTREPVPVALHFGCWAADVFRASVCSCAGRLRDSMAAIERAGVGVLIYVTADGLGTCGPEPAEADAALAAQILADLDLPSTRPVAA